MINYISCDGSCCTVGMRSLKCGGRHEMCLKKTLKTSKMQYVPFIALIMLFVCYIPLSPLFMCLIKLCICHSRNYIIFCF